MVHEEKFLMVGICLWSQPSRCRPKIHIYLFIYLFFLKAFIVTFFIPPSAGVEPRAL
jgi:hypothetical protein